MSRGLIHSWLLPDIAGSVSACRVRRSVTHFFSAASVSRGLSRNVARSVRQRNRKSREFIFTFRAVPFLVACVRRPAGGGGRGGGGEGGAGGGAAGDRSGGGETDRQEDIRSTEREREREGGGGGGGTHEDRGAGVGGAHEDRDPQRRGRDRHRFTVWEREEREREEGAGGAQEDRDPQRRGRDRDRFTVRERESNLLFYDQPTSTVISERERSYKITVLIT